MASYDGENAGRMIQHGLERVARAIDHYTESRAQIARDSLANMTDEKLERLERVVQGLLALQDRD